MLGFWETLKNKKKPFFALAPMADVTDISFRQTVAKYSKRDTGGGPDVFWTEFVSADGLILGGKESLMKDLAYTEAERPIVAQLFGSNPLTMRQAAKIVTELGFDGIDINMGCPDKSIEKQGAGASMIKNPTKAEEIIRAVKMGIHDTGKVIPVSVKTRVGYYRDEIETWIPFLLKQDLAVLTVHARTRKELSKVPARWELLKQVVRLRDSIAPETLIIGNGDIIDMYMGKTKAHQTGVDGVMIGRSVLGNPWIFHEASVIQQSFVMLPRFLSKILPASWVKKLKGYRKYTIVQKTKEERIEALLYHAELFEKYLKDHKHFSVIKRHIKAYINGFPGAKEMRQEIFDTVNSYSELKAYFESKR